MICVGKQERKKPKSGDFWSWTCHLRSFHLPRRQSTAQLRRQHMLTLQCLALQIAGWVPNGPVLIHLRPQADRAAEAAMKREEEAQQRQDAREVRSLYGVIWGPIEILLSKKLVKNVQKL